MLVWRRNSLYSLRTKSRKITHRRTPPKSAYPTSHHNNARLRLRWRWICHPIWSVRFQEWGETLAAIPGSMRPWNETKRNRARCISNIAKRRLSKWVWWLKDCWNKQTHCWVWKMLDGRSFGFWVGNSDAKKCQRVHSLTPTCMWWERLRKEIQFTDN